MVFKFEPVGVCIYCGVNNVKLTDEHVIPFSLNGGSVLPKASCEACAGITHQYEHTVARTIFGSFRMRHKVQTRRPHLRPTQMKIGTLMPDGSRGTARVPMEEVPTRLFIYKFDHPTFLRGMSSDIEDFKWLPYAILGSEEMKAFAAKYHWDSKVSVKMVPVEFARMLAKIAYAQVVGEFGLGGFDAAPTLLDVILCRTSNVSYLVGGDWELPPPDPAGLHIISLCVVHDSGQVLITTEIRLFPAFDMPLYRVVVGTMNLQNALHAVAFNKLINKPGSTYGLLPSSEWPFKSTHTCA